MGTDFLLFKHGQGAFSGCEWRGRACGESAQVPRCGAEASLKIGVRRPQMCEPPPKRNQHFALSPETFSPNPCQRASCHTQNLRRKGIFKGITQIIRECCDRPWECSEFQHSCWLAPNLCSNRQTPTSAPAHVRGCHVPSTSRIPGSPGCGR